MSPLEIFAEPVTFKEPVKLWLSSNVSPNLVEPLVKSIEAETNSVWNSWAVSVPPTVTSFAKIALPLPPSNFNEFMVDVSSLKNKSPLETNWPHLRFGSCKYITGAPPPELLIKSELFPEVWTMLISLEIEILSSFSILNGVLVCVVKDIVPVPPEEPKVISVLPCNTVTPPILYEPACAAPPIVNVEVLLPLISPEAVIGKVKLIPVCFI